MLQSSMGIAESMAKQVDLLKKELKDSEKYKVREGMGLPELKAVVDEARVELQAK